MSVRCSQGRLHHLCWRDFWLAWGITLWLRAPFLVTGHCYLRTGPFVLSPLPREGNFFILWSCICRSKRGKVVARTETREDLCPKFSSTKKKHRTSWIESEWEVDQSNIWIFSITSHYERQFFTKRQLHTKLLSFGSKFRKNNGQLKRRYGNIYMNKCIFKINNIIFPTKFEIKKLYAWKYQLHGYPWLQNTKIT